MKATEFQKKVSNLNWKLNYENFCREIMGLKGNPEDWQRDLYYLEKWNYFQQLNEALSRFSAQELENIENFQTLKEQKPIETSPPEERHISIRQLKININNAHWKLDLETFCKKVLNQKASDVLPTAEKEIWGRNMTILAKWEAFNKLIEGINYLTVEELKAIIFSK